MLSSGIIDLAIGMAFIFAATAGLASVITEMIARFLGLRGAYLLLGLRELVDDAGASVTLSNAIDDWKKAQKLITGDKSGAAGGQPEAAAGTPPATARKPEVTDGTSEVTGDPSSVTAALLGSPILSSQGMTGTINNRDLTLDGKRVKAAPRTGGTTTKTPEGSQQKKSRIPAPLQKVIGPFRTWKQRRSLPSYISSRSFAEAIIDLLVPDKTGETGMTVIQGRIKTMTEQMPSQMGTLGYSLNSLAANANGDVDRFRTSIEQWYDDHMARVSGWYKRRTAWITLLAGGILVLLLNINTFTIGRALYSDSATRTAVSAAAAAGNPCPKSSSPSQQDCLAKLEKQVSAVAQAGLPLGWAAVPACVMSGSGTSGSGTSTKACGLLDRYGITTPGNGSPWQVIVAVIGFLATIVALAPGAQFWFGLVVKLNSLRSSGPPPASSASSAS